MSKRLTFSDDELRWLAQATQDFAFFGDESGWDADGHYFSTPYALRHQRKNDMLVKLGHQEMVELKTWPAGDRQLANRFDCPAERREAA